MLDPFDLQRFVEAQENVFEDACAELAAGKKRTHWMWFVFPQLAGLGSSAMARRYAIGSLAEARAHLAHPLLGQRLARATEAALGSGERDATRLFGPPDDMKFRSSMTLFARAAPAGSVFATALATFFAGEDQQTVNRLGQDASLDP